QVADGGARLVGRSLAPAQRHGVRPGVCATRPGQWFGTAQEVQCRTAASVVRGSAPSCIRCGHGRGNRRMRSDEALIVIGAGHAGAELAVQAREAGWPGHIALVGDESALPYHRPPLSKAYLAGAAPLDTLALKARATYERAGIELMLGRRVAGIDRTAARVSFEDGHTMAYSRLAFATGGRPRPLPAAASGADAADNFHYLRTLADVDRIRSRFIPGSRLAIVGGGYVGLEVAAVAAKQGLK